MKINVEGIVKLKELKTWESLKMLSMSVTKRPRLNLIQH